MQRDAEMLLQPVTTKPKSTEDRLLDYLRAFYAAVPKDTPRAKADMQFAHLAVDLNLITSSQLRDCLDMQSFMQPPVPPIGLLLVRLGLLDEPRLKRLVDAQRRQVPAADAGARKPPPRPPAPGGPPPSAPPRPKGGSRGR
jgi:hypothetical protein